ncbi:3-(methylthio)propionyl-CoA ligase [Streptomyces sp. LHD-70]|uniref:3-(methylthio)propionyl-CoA ligase n=1 Tax=Streptomyces sp. LHD-70 TaxID=3072140 RepID=UPI00280D92E3|nr:3-(methylthio)propionyl-CoA ligase [Streptomyces sp. LHD-70]MDQ8704043.1 3-(methylthio)propionyl-CoA ligase [Streptomyces sp. LHD-70]
MNGLMMHQQLLVSSLLTHAERHHANTEVVSVRCEGDIHRYTFRDLAHRSRQVAQAVEALGVGPGDRVATLAWNGYRHLELYYGVSGAGSVLHTLNPRLHPDQLVWIINNADDSVLFFDLTFVDLIRQIAPRVPCVRKFVLLSDAEHLAAAWPADDALEVAPYEDLVAAQDGDYTWPTFDEKQAASLCYTSGTTGHPKGVLYSHRSTVLHSYGVALPDSMGLSARDVVMPVVPMFHVNAWGIPYAACLTGTKLVLPGKDLSGAALTALQEAEGVTISGSVPTVWQGQLDHARVHGITLDSLQRAVIGGAACPAWMLRELQDVHGVRVIHGWGMTETSPLGAASVLKLCHDGLDRDAQEAVLAKQGRTLFGIDLKIIDDEGAELPWDGRTPGHLMVRGHWVTSGYYPPGRPSPLIDGWFPTGDVATIDPEGFMQITDRSKDLIKSGGEWISSIEIENLAMDHPEVETAACIGVRHTKWDERPILVAVRRPGSTLTAKELLGSFTGKIAKWCVPDDAVFVETLPMGATGKILKAPLRKQYQERLMKG